MKPAAGGPARTRSPRRRSRAAGPPADRKDRCKSGECQEGGRGNDERGRLPPALPLLVEADGLDVVAGGIEHVGGVVVGVVVRAQSRLAVVAAPRLQGGGVELVDRGARPSLKRQVVVLRRVSLS